MYRGLLTISRTPGGGVAASYGHPGRLDTGIPGVRAAYLPVCYLDGYVLAARTASYHRRPAVESPQAAWLEDGIRFHFEAQRIRALDKTPGDVRFEDPRFGPVLAKLQEMMGVPFDVRWNKLAAVRVRPTSTPRARLSQMSFAGALGQLCSEVGVYQGDVEFRFVNGAVTISTAKDFETDLVSRVYPMDVRTVEYVTAAMLRYDSRSEAKIRFDEGRVYITAPSWELRTIHEWVASTREKALPPMIQLQ